VPDLLEARVQFSALVVTLVKAGELDAVDELWDWAEEWLDVNREELEEGLEIEDA
jgi:hypothetical protein